MFKPHSFLAIASAAAALLLSANAYASDRAPPQTAGLTAEISQHDQQSATPLFAYGYGYGRGWCYWHPYSCYGEDDSSDDSDE